MSQTTSVAAAGPAPSQGHRHDPAHEHGHEHSDLLFVLAGGILVLNAFLIEYLFEQGEALGGLSALVGSLMLSWTILKRSIEDLRQGVLHMNELVALGVLGCFALGEYKVAGFVAFFMHIADMIQHKTALGARRAVEDLIRLTPQTATLLGEDGSESTVPSAGLRPGQIVRVRPGQNIPVDGVITSGSTSIDESNITGESVPVDKAGGTSVYAGTNNLTSPIDIRVEKAGEETTLGRVHELILKAESSKTAFMSVIDRYSSWYTPTVIMIAAIVWFFTHDAYRSIFILVVTCPCALILASPTAVVAALSASARLGVLVKDMSSLETAANLNAVIFDKTGTLTTGRLSVARTEPAEGVDRSALLRTAAAVALGSNHPASRAVIAAASEAGIEVLAAKNIVERAGKGMAGSHAGRRVLLGRRVWLEEQGVQIPEHTVSDEITPLYAAEDGRCLGWIGLRDETRADARAAVNELKQLGVRRVMMLTGDRRAVAERISDELGCTDVQAECLPEGKLRMVEALKKDGYRVAVVGDGVNDAPALASGHIGIAMGTAGHDISINSAGIALMSDNLTRIPFLIRLSRRLRSVMHQNLAFGVIFVLFGMISGGFGWITHPVIAALLHNAGALFVIFNSARLVRFGEEQLEAVPRKSA